MKALDAKKRKLYFSVLILVIACVAGICTFYLTDCYSADMDAISAFLPAGLEWKEEADGTILFSPEGAEKGFIFYPGGKVEYTAYIPLMQTLSEQGVLCVLVKMPFHLAVFDIRAADGIREKYPEIREWYIGGHSLGGAMASVYLAEHTEDFAGLILLGSYSTETFTDTNLNVVSVYGSEDKVLNWEKYQANRANLPEGFTEVVIEGGCHAYFGMYGAQKGDGTPTVTNEEQIRVTVEEIMKAIR